ncbi:helix-turn-helix domain-containing protein [Ensifer adhaerens]|uniref:helix-turn-helix domain-containing protein n=1 Tax=Ensifer adhaerens TaxID=106592 RepID=UPI001569FD37|nr:helix-turn-helix transcriptional regulator [Ensifer adhaerens]
MRNVRKATSTDLEIGRRLRRRRKAMGMLQQELAAKLSVSCQLIQKYETGQIRIGAGRLSTMAGALGVSAAFFYEGGQAADAPQSVAGETELYAFLGTTEGMALNTAFQRIRDPRLRRCVLALILAAGNDRER